MPFMPMMPPLAFNPFFMQPIINPFIGIPNRQTRSSDGRMLKNTPTIINIPIPKIEETELEVVHVFPQGYPGANGMGGGYSPYGGYGYGGNESYAGYMPSYSVVTTLNGTETTNNFWGYNPAKKSGF